MRVASIARLIDKLSTCTVSSPLKTVCIYYAGYLTRALDRHGTVHERLLTSKHLTCGQWKPESLDLFFICIDAHMFLVPSLIEILAFSMSTVLLVSVIS